MSGHELPCARSPLRTRHAVGPEPDRIFSFGHAEGALPGRKDPFMR